MITKFKTIKSSDSNEFNNLLEGIFSRFSQVESGKTFVSATIERSSILPDLEIADDRIKSLIRQKEAEIQHLRDHIRKIQSTRTISSTEGQGEMIRVLQVENMKLKN